MSTLRRRIGALLMRLARHGLPSRADGHRRMPEHFTPIERVLRRCAVHVSRTFAAYVNLQALLSAGVTRHTRRVEMVQPRGREARVHTLRQRERVTVIQRALHERLLERRMSAAASAAAPRAAMVTRVEQRSAFPRVQLTMVRVQPAMPSPARTTAQSPAVSASDWGPAPTTPRPVAVAPALVLPPQELSRLTDHVIRQLDHRVLSYQERTGRI